MRKFLVLAASSAVLLASPAFANDHGDDSGWYLRANGGYGIHHDAEFDEAIFNGDVESEGNVTGSVGIGYEFGDGSDFENFRIELDADSLWTDMGAVDQWPNSFAKLRTNTLMANILYDFDFGDSDVGGMDIQPYVGVGAGLVQGKLRAEAHDIAVVPGPGTIDNGACLDNVSFGACSIDDTDTTWGWQALAGVGVEIADNLFWDTHYTYMKADVGGLDFDATYTPLFPDRNAPRNAFTHLAELDDIGAHTVVTGLRYKFGDSYTPPPPPPPPPPAVIPAPAPTFTCWDGETIVRDMANCPAKPAPVTYYTCWDNSQVTDLASCPSQPVPEPVTTYTCWDNTVVSDLAYCPVQPAPSAQFNNCGASNVAIFNVPVNKTPKQMPRLGTMPEFGDSHGLTPNQFFEKLQARYASSATDKAYLNYLFKSMGYSNGFADAQSYMFSEEILPVGTRGLLGLGKQHHYEYSVLPSNDRDRQAFRIQSANGSVIHFMKTCGNYMYACN